MRCTQFVCHVLVRNLDSFDSVPKEITPQISLALRNQLNWDDPWHATFWAVCLVAFFGLLRKVNLLCKGSTQFNPSKQMRRRDIIFFPTGPLSLTDGPRQSNLASDSDNPSTSHRPASPLSLHVSQACFQFSTCPFVGPSLCCPSTKRLDLSNICNV